MPRARNIKPSFFTNDLLAEIEPLGRLLFVGLWTLADREGRIEYRPKRIKAELLPYDDCDVEKLVHNLCSLNFVKMYEVGEQQYIHILNFRKHQNPHPNEKASELPAPPDVTSTHEKERQESEDSQSNRADVLIPDSGSLNPESISPDGDTGTAVPSCPHQKIIDTYHEVLPELRSVREWTDNRKALLRARWREKPERRSLEWWREYFQRVAQSDFLMGRANGDARPFQADLEWLIRPNNMPKVLEGKYDKGGKQPNSNDPVVF